MPTAVVVTTKDRAVAVRRQYRLAAAIPGAEVHIAKGGHASIVLDAKNWVPVLLDALTGVVGRLEPVGQPLGTE